MEHPIGYAAFLQDWEGGPAPRHLSRIEGSTRVRTSSREGTHETFPEQFLRDTSPIGHLVFALKYDGVDLRALQCIFAHLGKALLEHAVRAQPSSTYLRRLWFFYEFLLGDPLDLPDTESGAYVDALPADQYIVRQGAKLRRYRVNFNLLGATSHWCPIVRRTQKLREYEDAQLHELAHGAVAALDAHDLRRAIRYLYTKETRASFEIERTAPTDRTERFVEALLAQRFDSGTRPWWATEDFVQVAGEILGDPRFMPQGYRHSEVRVSEQRSLAMHERVHFVGPRHRDVPSLMEGLIDAWRAHHSIPPRRPQRTTPVVDTTTWRSSSGDPFVDFVVAASLSFGFVFIHPFEDGNGRLHRLMLHRILSATGFTPPGVVIPVSAAILHDLAGYDVALEDFSTRVMPFVQYEIDESDGSMTVLNDTAGLYRYPDLTAQTEALCGWFESAVRHELVEELQLLRAIDAAKQAMRKTVELPDARENLFIRVCMQSFQAGSGYRLSQAKRRLFNDLSEDEIAALEQGVDEAFRNG